MYWKYTLRFDDFEKTAFILYHDTKSKYGNAILMLNFSRENDQINKISSELIDYIDSNLNLLVTTLRNPYVAHYISLLIIN